MVPLMITVLRDSLFAILASFPTTKFSINRYPLQLLASSSISHRVAIYKFTNPELLTVNGTLPSGRLIITIRRDILGGMHEDIDVINHHSDRVEFQLMLAVRSDFADILVVSQIF